LGEGSRRTALVQIHRKYVPSDYRLTKTQFVIARLVRVIHFPFFREKNWIARTSRAMTTNGGASPLSPDVQILREFLRHLAWSVKNVSVCICEPMSLVPEQKME
jgi:hypothetical protein